MVKKSEGGSGQREQHSDMRDKEENMEQICSNYMNKHLVVGWSKYHSSFIIFIWGKREHTIDLVLVCSRVVTLSPL